MSKWTIGINANNTTICCLYDVYELWNGVHHVSSILLILLPIAYVLNNIVLSYHHYGIYLLSEISYICGYAVYYQ